MNTHYYPDIASMLRHCHDIAIGYGWYLRFHCHYYATLYWCRFLSLLIVGHIIGCFTLAITHYYCWSLVIDAIISRYRALLISLRHYAIAEYDINIIIGYWPLLLPALAIAISLILLLRRWLLLKIGWLLLWLWLHWPLAIPYYWLSLFVTTSSPLSLLIITIVISYFHCFSQ